MLVAEAVARRTKASEHLRKFDDATSVLFGLLALPVLACLWSGSVMRTSRVAQVDDRLEFATGSVSIMGSPSTNENSCCRRR